jgi:hypothetical protein
VCMSDELGSVRAPQPRRRPPVPRLPLATALRRSIAGAAATVLIVFTILAIRMGAGEDPALSMSGPSAKSQTSGSGLSTSTDSTSDPGSIVVQPAPTQTVAPAPQPVRTSTS